MPSTADRQFPESSHSSVFATPLLPSVRMFHPYSFIRTSIRLHIHFLRISLGLLSFQSPRLPAEFKAIQNATASPRNTISLKSAWQIQARWDPHFRNENLTPCPPILLEDGHIYRCGYMAAGKREPILADFIWKQYHLPLAPLPGRPLEQPCHHYADPV